MNHFILGVWVALVVLILIGEALNYLEDKETWQ